jgi:arsenate reductase-like glutaredoxin family protein
MLKQTNAAKNECYNELMIQRTNATTNECYNELMLQRTLLQRTVLSKNQDATTNTDATTNAEEYYRPT